MTAAMSAVKERYEGLCRELNMDRQTEEQSWRNFNEISNSFSLEGDAVHWFCCAMYAAGRRSCTPTVDSDSNAVVIGNGVSFNKLLRCCNMSVEQFFAKIKQWNDFAGSSQHFCRQIDRLERNFSITFNLCKNYHTIMQKLYVKSTEKKNTKYRSVPKCTSAKLHDFCWCFYLCVKNQNRKNVMDLVTAFHLLICCIDYVYKNVLEDNRVDLINPDFSGVPPNWGTSDFDRSTIRNHCILDLLCQLGGSSELPDVRIMSDRLSVIIAEFFRAKTIQGNANTFLGILSNEHFDINLKKLNSAYEQYVLSVGEFDERILLNTVNYSHINSADHGDRKEFGSLTPYTPYTRKNVLPSRELQTEPIASATNNVKRLNEIRHCSDLPEIIQQLGEPIVLKIRNNLEQMSTDFCNKYHNAEEATARFGLASCLFNYLLERIIRAEMRSKPTVDLRVLFNTDHFCMSLIACCLELVLAAYNTSEHKFPWILDCCNIKAFRFSKIIEIVVKQHDNVLTRTLIKHLNTVEETCLESLAWEAKSPLWEIIRPGERSYTLPTWSEVDVTNVTLRKELPVVQSPMNSACESFTPTHVTESARRDLFNSTKEASCSNANLKSTSQEDTEKKTQETMPWKGSLNIFLRKFYKLAWVRMKILCTELNMDNETVLEKIWTLFEHSITNVTELMQDRHLDQILMCAIYIYIRVCEMNIKFADIMSHYRKQPQSASETYRHVLINAPGSETRVYNDIIFFYNQIYVQKMIPYAYNFSEKKKSQHDLLLSPHPTEKRVVPIKVSNNHSLYISPMEKNEVLYSPNHITYEIGKSPAKDLAAMNDCVRGKRNLPFSDETTVIDAKLLRPNPITLEKCRDILRDRREE